MCKCQNAFSPGLHSCATRLRTSTAAGHCWMNSSQKELSSRSCAITRQALKSQQNTHGYLPVSKEFWVTPESHGVLENINLESDLYRNEDD